MAQTTSRGLLPAGSVGTMVNQVLSPFSQLGSGVSNILKGVSGMPMRTSLGSAAGTAIGTLFGAPTLGGALGGVAGAYAPQAASYLSGLSGSSAGGLRATGSQLPRTNNSPLPTLGGGGSSSAAGLTDQLNSMAASYAANQNRLSNLAQQSQKQAAAQQKAMGQYVDNAMQQSYAQNVAAQGVLRNMFNDPTMTKLVNAGMERMENPGFSQRAISTMKGNALARNAASANAQARTAMGAAARYGMQGPARAYQQSMLKNRNAYQSSREQGNIDLHIEQTALQDRGQAMSQAASMLGMRNSYGSQLADLMTRYDPMRNLAAGQSIMQPFSQIGYGIGNASFGGM